LARAGSLEGQARNHKIFEPSSEIGLWRLTANRISEIFGVRLNKRLRGNTDRVAAFQARSLKRPRRLSPPPKAGPARHSGFSPLSGNQIHDTLVPEEKR
jgi:hypothetical protein